MIKEFAFVLLEEDCVDEKGNWDLVLTQYKGNEITISCVSLGALEGKVFEFTHTAEEYRQIFRGFVDLNDGLFEFQRYQYDILMKKYFE